MRILCAFAAWLSLAAPVAAQSTVSIDENRIRAEIRNGKTFVNVPVLNSGREVLRGTLSLWWTDLEGKSGTPAELQLAVPPGESTASVESPLSSSSTWLRLEYSLNPDLQRSRLFTAVQGTVALRSIAAYVFELSAARAGVIKPNEEFRVLAQAVHPSTKAPVNPERWEAVLARDGKTWKPVRSKKLPGGFHEFTFVAPPLTEEERDDREVLVGIRAFTGDFEQTAELEAVLDFGANALIHTDKPIYQPGQVLHWRALIRNAAGRPFGDAAVRMELQNADGELVSTRSVTSSKFGILHDDWAIPASLEPGEYQIRLQLEEEDLHLGTQWVRISRYELPSFRVEVRPDRKTYLEGQQPTVEIRASYLFGKPVPGAKVTITRRPRRVYAHGLVRQAETADKPIEGTANAEGVVQLALPLGAEDYPAGEWGRYRDLEFEALVTDPLSGRAEPKRFDLRTTREAIHVYVLQGSGGGPLPVRAYVSAAYADGSAAACMVKVEGKGISASARTNRYGVAAIDLPASAEGAELVFRATDQAGATGSQSERFEHAGGGRIRISSDKTLHRTGEAVHLKLTLDNGSPDPQALLVQAIAEGNAVATQNVNLVGGSGTLTFPYQAEFRRQVTFVAWNAVSVAEEARWSALGQRTVLFPDAADLRVTASSAKPEYRPGETAELQFSVLSKNGAAVRAALGVAVVDEAVLERANSMQEFGGKPYFECRQGDREDEQRFAGIGISDLLALDRNKPFAAELDLVAEALTSQETTPFWRGDSAEQPRFAAFELQKEQLSGILRGGFEKTLAFPRSVAELRRALPTSLSALPDPWGVPYQAEFDVMGADYVIRMSSNGPDKRRGTPDDFQAFQIKQPYFEAWDKQIGFALRGATTFPGDEVSCRRLLESSGIALLSLRDPWGTPLVLKVRTHRTNRKVSIYSAGPDRKFDPETDTLLAEYSGIYFQREAERISLAVRNAKPEPQTEAQFRSLLKAVGLDIDQFRDDWGQPLRVTSIDAPYYADRLVLSTEQVYGQKPESKTKIVPVTRKVRIFLLLSIGPDRIEGTYDDFEMAGASVVLSEEEALKPSEPAPRPAVKGAPGTGRIVGVVLDPSGAWIPGASVHLTDAGGVEFEAKAGTGGLFYFFGVPPGKYQLSAYSMGFQTYRVKDIPLTTGGEIVLEVVLQVGSVSETVVVQASPQVISTESASVAERAQATSTPRVREYFPETLLWLPEAITDGNGRSSTSLKLADSITNWKIAVFASTEDGRIAQAEGSFRTFQPFFLDFQPPAVLTEGDELELPVAVRNYTKSGQEVSVEWEPSSSLSLQGGTSKRVKVAAGETQSVVFAVSASRHAAGAKQKVQVSGLKAGDAVVRTLQVRPNGREVRTAWNSLLIGPVAHQVQLPDRVLPGTIAAELKIFPSLDALLWETVESMLKAPHGCGEQTISGGFSNLVALQVSRRAGRATPGMEKRARAHIQMAIDALPGFRGANGGVAYWALGAGDAAVTAFAVRFLLEAASEATVDKDAVQELVTWLERNGPASNLGNGLLSHDTGALSLWTRSLAAARKAGFKVDSAVLGRAFGELLTAAEAREDPYLLAQLLQAGLDAQLQSLPADLGDRLASQAQDQRSGSGWLARINTPFQGWGVAGMVETTGAAVSALHRWRLEKGPSPRIDSAIQRGLHYLFTRRDPLGWWYSTQATLAAMQALSQSMEVLGQGARETVVVKCNGKEAQKVSLPSTPKSLDAIPIDLSGCLRPGSNTIELNSTASARAASVSLLTTYWLPIVDEQPPQNAELRLSVAADRLEVAAGERTRLLVRAERVGFRGQGMMIAEVPVPPGAEVDRQALQRVVEAANSGLRSFDVHPDRVLLYLEPAAGGTQLPVWLTLRLKMRAQSGAAVLYDYYNPEARAETRPMMWKVR